MQLVACAEPVGPLETAPETALLAGGGTDEATGFWGDDDRYYARVVDRAGAVRWYTLGDSAPVRDAGRVVVPHPIGPRVTLVARATRAHGGALVWATRTRRRG